MAAFFFITEQILSTVSAEVPKSISLDQKVSKMYNFSVTHRAN